MHCLWSTQGDIICSQPQSQKETFDTIEHFNAPGVCQQPSMSVEVRSVVYDSLNRATAFTIPIGNMKTATDAAALGWRQNDQIANSSQHNPRNLSTTSTIANVQVPSPQDPSVALITLSAPMNLLAGNVCLTFVSNIQRRSPAPVAPSSNANRTVQVNVTDVNGTRPPSIVKTSYFWISKADYAKVQALFPNKVVQLASTVSIASGGSTGTSTVLAIHENIRCDPSVVQIVLSNAIDMRVGSATLTFQ